MTGPVNIGNPGEFTIRNWPRSSSDDRFKSEIYVTSHFPPMILFNGNPISAWLVMLDNWEPIVQLKEGLEKTISYFDELIGK